jgi:hypothetical protein
MPIPSRFQLYEMTVQSPNWQVDYLPQFHEWLTGVAPRHFREDFCGSARITCEWVKRHPQNTACGLDLDSGVLAYAQKFNLKRLTAQAQKRITLKKQDVRTPTRKKYDWIGAFNYSLFTFQDRKDLIRYFKSTHQSIGKRGTLFLEIAGGPGFLRPSIQKKTLRIAGVGRVTQAWEQQAFDPVTGMNDYAIHFQLPDRSWIQNAFTYHWRIWGIREIREALQEAGFKKTVVLWQKSDSSGEPTNELLPVEEAPQEDFYLCYVVGVKGS